MKNLRSTQANALIVTLFFVTILTAFISIAYNVTAHNALNGGRSSEMNAAYSIADGTIELLYARWRYSMKATSENLTVDELTSANNPWGSDITAIDLPTLIGSTNAANTNLTINSIQLSHVDIYGRPQPDDATIDPSQPITGPSDPVYFSASPVGAGFTGFNIIYEAKVWVTSNLHGNINTDGSVNGNPVTVGVKRFFTKGVSPTMQAAIFYENQLELHPGSNMLISGLVHTNDNLYACGYAGKSILSFGDQVSHVGYYNQDASGARMMTDADRGTTITNESTQLSTPDFINGATLQQTGRMSVGGVDPSDLHPDNSTVVNYNDDSYREVIERPVNKASEAGADPSVTAYNDFYDSDPSSIASQRLYNQASLKILLTKNTDGTMKVTIRQATPAGMADGPLVPTTSSLYKDIVKAINPGTSNTGVNAGPRTTMDDLREAGTGAGNVQVTTVDMSMLRTAIANDISATVSTDPSYFNGVLYISDTTGGSSTTGSYNDQIDQYNPSMTDDSETIAGNRVKHGIMLTNAAELPQNTPTSDTPAGDHYFTMATDNAVYIKGDYNTGGSGTTVPTNLDPNATSTVDKANTSYTSVTSAIMADAVGVVSNLFNPTMSNAGLWDTYQSDDSTAKYYVSPTTTYQSTNPTGAFYVPPGDAYSGQPVANMLVRGAEPTTVNTAVVSGYSPTHDMVSSGGAQNLVRLLENWSDPSTYDPINFTYKGSLMQSYISKEYNGDWSNAYYQNPNRQVRFDSGFLTTPPKATPTTIVFVRGTWERFSEPVPAS